MRRLPLLVLAGVLTAVAPAATSASAATPSYGPVVTACVEKVSALPSGRVYGAGDCGRGARLLVRDPGGAWRSAATLWPGYRVEALAADATASFVVVSCDRLEPPCEAGGPSGAGYLIGKVPHGGTRSALTRLGASETTGPADVVAKDGRWFAAWTQTFPDRDRPGSGSQEAHWATTMGGTRRGTFPPATDEAPGRVFTNQPSLALAPSGVRAAYTSYRPDDASPTSRLLLDDVTTSGAGVPTPYRPAAGADVSFVRLVVSGGTTLLGWAAAGRPFVGVGGRAVALPFRGAPDALTLAASGGRLFLTTGECFGQPRTGTTNHVYARVLDSTGRLLSSTDVAGVPVPSCPASVGVPTGATAARGVGTVALGLSSSQRRVATSR